MNLSPTERILLTITILAGGYRALTGHWPISVEVENE